MAGTGQPLLQRGQPALVGGKPVLGNCPVCCDTEPPPTDGCQCVDPIITVTMTIAGMTGGGSTYNGTYAGVAYTGSGILCGARYDWEEIEPTPSVEIVITFSRDDTFGSTVLADKPGGVNAFRGGFVTPVNDGGLFCSGTPIVFPTNESPDNPGYGGTITITVD